MSHKALVHSTWITQPILSNSKLEVICQTVLFLVMCANYLSQTSLNWSQPTILDADVMCQVLLGSRAPWLLRTAKFPLSLELMLTKWLNTSTTLNTFWVI